MINVESQIKEYYDQKDAIEFNQTIKETECEKNWVFFNSIKNIDDDSLVIYESDAYDLSREETRNMFALYRYPMCYIHYYQFFDSNHL